MTNSIDSFNFFIKRTALVEKTEAHVVIRLLGLFFLLLFLLFLLGCKANRREGESLNKIKHVLKHLNERVSLPGASPPAGAAAAAAVAGAAPPPAPTLQIRLPMSMLARA